MTETILTIIAGIIFIIGPFILIYKMDKRTSKKGALFSGVATSRQRMGAILLGILFGLISIYMFFVVREVSLLFVVVTILLIDYGFGGKLFINKLQQVQTSTKPHMTAGDSVNETLGLAPSEQEQTWLISKRWLNFLFKIAIIMIVSGIFLSVAWWAATHQDSPWAIVIVIVVIVFLVLARFLDFIGFIRRWFK